MSDGTGSNRKGFSSMDLVGTKLGQYQVIRKIGKGGMGDVFEALDTALHRRVAIKIINRKYRFDDEAKNRFQREAQILSKIDNPHICRVYEFIATKDCDCLVVELIDGRPLETVLSDGLEAAQKLSVARQLLEAVESAHKLGIVHRDLNREPDGDVLWFSQSIGFRSCADER